MSFVRLKFMVIVFLIGACLIFSAPTISAAAAGDLRVGAAKVDITPKAFTGLVSVWAKAFEGVHDPIYARVLLLESGGATTAFVALDLVEYGDSTPVRERIRRELKIPVDHVMVFSSHAHSAPRGGPVTRGTSSEQGRPYSTPAYDQQIEDAVLDALGRARASMQPARVGIGTGRADINVNRTPSTYMLGEGWKGKNPDGPSDKTVWVVKFESPSGAPIALLMNYAVHSTVVGPRNTQLSGDLAGAVQRYVEAQFGNEVVALWTMGPAGDQNPKYNAAVLTRDSETNADAVFEAVDAMGQILGAEVVQTANRIERMRPTARITAAERVVFCPVKTPFQPSSEGASKKPSGPPAGGIFGPLRGPVPEPTTPLTEMDIHLQLIQINEIALAGVSGEVFTNIYSRLKEASPFTNTLMVTMANDRAGYISDDATWERVHNDAFAHGFAEKAIVDNLAEMMNGMLQ